MDASSEKKSLAQSPSESAELSHKRDVTVKDVEEGQYPVGFKLAILASAALVAVFLIALDQVSSLLSFPPRSFDRWIPDYHRYSYPSDHRRLSRSGGCAWYATAYFMTFGAAHASAGKMYKYLI
jgi:hypothetical protein